MAVSSHDKQNLSKDDQNKIADVTSKAERGEMSWADAHSQAESIRNNAGYSGGADGSGNFIVGDETGGFGDTPVSSGGRDGGGGGSKGGENRFRVSDYSDYLKDLYAANTAAQLAALKAAYEQNTADLDANAEKIPKIYYAARNETAAQSDLARQSFNEYAAARGLNTGTSGQAELSRSSTLQGNLADIAGREADALAANDLARQKLAAQYSSAVAQAEANGNAQLAQALYQEYVRQDSAAQQAADLARQQENWQTQFDFTQRQYQDSQLGSQRQQAHELAMTMLAAGVMPDTATLNAAGVSTADALAMQAAVQQQAARGKTSSGGGSGKPTLTYTQMMDAINSGNLTPGVLAAYQYYMGTSYGGGEAAVPTFTTQQEAAAYIQKSGKSASGLMTATEWTRHKNSGNDQSGASNYRTYQEYLNDYVAYILGRG